MTYLIVILLTIINVLFVIKKNKDKNILLKYKLSNYYKYLITLNIIVIILLMFFTGLYILTNISQNIILNLISLGVIFISFALLLFQKKKYISTYNILKRVNYINTMIIIFIISLLIGDRGRVIDVSSLLIIPVLIDIILIFITANKENIELYIIKEKEEENKEKKYNKKIHINTVFYITIITFLVLILIDNSLLSYVAYTIIIVSIFIYIINRKKKIKKEQKKMISSLKENNNKPGTKYIFEFQKDIINIKTSTIYAVIILVALIIYTLISNVYILLIIQLLMIILYINLLNKIKLNKIYNSLNKKEIENYYKKIDNTPLDDISINDRLLDIKYDKVIYIKDKDVYESESLLYNIKDNEINNIELYVNTLNYNDYIFVVEEIYE